MAWSDPLAWFWTTIGRQNRLREVHGSLLQTCTSWLHRHQERFWWSALLLQCCLLLRSSCTSLRSRRRRETAGSPTLQRLLWKRTDAFLLLFLSVFWFSVVSCLFSMNHCIFPHLYVYSRCEIIILLIFLSTHATLTLKRLLVKLLNLSSLPLCLFVVRFSQILSQTAVFASICEVPSAKRVPYCNGISRQPHSLSDSCILSYFQTELFYLLLVVLSQLILTFQ